MVDQISVSNIHSMIKETHHRLEVPPIVCLTRFYLSAPITCSPCGTLSNCIICYDAYILTAGTCSQSATATKNQVLQDIFGHHQQHSTTMFLRFPQQISIHLDYKSLFW